VDPGRHGHSLDAFEFPSLRHVLAADLDPGRADMSHEELVGWFGAWPRHSIAFGARPGVLWAGTPAGALIETDLDSGQAATQHVLGGTSVVPDDRDFHAHLVVTDGYGHGSQRTWQP
jgi:hypothetical protein